MGEFSQVENRSQTAGDIGLGAATANFRQGAGLSVVGNDANQAVVFVDRQAVRAQDAAGGRIDLFGVLRFSGTQTDHFVTLGNLRVHRNVEFENGAKNRVDELWQRQVVKIKGDGFLAIAGAERRCRKRRTARRVACG